ncbi:hypothetical protein CDAR_34451 [Caerostris darwini]|uniref:Uncharacterized protein n=1 Tax=Caerostris darwini TaxID=1538125 RepID=A0AAV4MIE6_9ARAC|nr:hypothetical protein CDAR_34451 [Caerostris darwini]
MRFVYVGGFRPAKLQNEVFPNSRSSYFIASSSSALKTGSTLETVAIFLPREDKELEPVTPHSSSFIKLIFRISSTIPNPFHAVNDSGCLETPKIAQIDIRFLSAEQVGANFDRARALPPSCIPLFLAAKPHSLSRSEFSLLKSRLNLMSQFTESVGEHSEAGSRTACSHVWGPPICHSQLHEALYKKPSNSRDRLRKVAVPSKGLLIRVNGLWAAIRKEAKGSPPYSSIHQVLSYLCAISLALARVH